MLVYQGVTKQQRKRGCNWWFYSFHWEMRLWIDLYVINGGETCGAFWTKHVVLANRNHGVKQGRWCASQLNLINKHEIEAVRSTRDCTKNMFAASGMRIQWISPTNRGSTVRNRAVDVFDIWLVVWTPRKNMKVNWDDYSQYMGK